MGAWFSGRMLLSKRRDQGSIPCAPAFGSPKRTYGVATPAFSQTKLGLQRDKAAGRFAKATFINKYMYYVYSLKCKDGYYIGCTEDFEDRINRHKKGQVLATANRLPLRLDFYFAIVDKYKAFELEKYLKSGSGRAFINKHLA